MGDKFSKSNINNVSGNVLMGLLISYQETIILKNVNQKKLQHINLSLFGELQ